MVVDVLGSWDFSNDGLDISINYPSCIYVDCFDFYFIIPQSLAFNLEICVLTLLYDFPLDVVVTWYHYIYEDTPVGTIMSGSSHSTCLSVLTGELLVHSLLPIQACLGTSVMCYYSEFMDSIFLRICAVPRIVDLRRLQMLWEFPMLVLIFLSTIPVTPTTTGMPSTYYYYYYYWTMAQ